MKKGDKFCYHGIDFTYLGEEQGGALCVCSKIYYSEMKFSNNSNNGCNDWKTSYVRKRLHDDFEPRLNGEDLIEFESDLTSDDGLKDYGTCKDKVFLLSCDLYRKYRAFMPKYDDYLWTLTPWSCIAGVACTVRGVYPAGQVYNYNASNALGVAPACLFNPEIFKSASTEAGKLVIEDASKMNDEKVTLESLNRDIHELKQNIEHEIAIIKDAIEYIKENV